MFKVKIPNKKKIIKRVKKQFFEAFKYELNFSNPQTLSEKINWLKLYYKDRLLTQCTDKYRVREYVENVIGKKYLIDLISIYNNQEEINFDLLPNQFVLKVTNSSGGNIFCTDKASLNIEDTRAKLKGWMQDKENFYFTKGEWAYKHTKSRIICEPLLAELGELIDYRFHCFHGTPQEIFVSREYSKDLTVADRFDMSWNKLPLGNKKYKTHDVVPRKPINFELMIEFCKKLSKPFPYVRVDLYEHKGAVIFSELTFYPGSGLISPEDMPREYARGRLLRLPKKTGIFKSMWIALASQFDR